MAEQASIQTTTLTYLVGTPADSQFLPFLVPQEASSRLNDNTLTTLPNRKRKYDNADLVSDQPVDRHAQYSPETERKESDADVWTSSGPRVATHKLSPTGLPASETYLADSTHNDDATYRPASPSSYKPADEDASSLNHYHDGLPPKALKRLPGTTPHDDSERVASHYNRRRQLNLNERSESSIIYMRNFNNWIKSVVIGKHAVRDGTVLDLGCGKGGDLLKWGKGRIRRLVGLDIAEKSIHDARKRWEDMRAPKFDAEFHTLDCFSYPLSTRISRNEIFDVVSMQFALHYSFESEEKVLRILQNITSNLKIGGSFIGTIPDANWIVKKLKSLPEDELKFGNSRYYIRFEQKDEYPLFGHRYIFNLEDAIQECPEYLVHFPTFVSLAERYGLELVYKMRFHDLYAENKDEPRFRDLLYKMRVISDDGEMSEDEWEAVGIYMAFAFRKVR